MPDQSAQPVPPNQPRRDVSPQGLGAQPSRTNPDDPNTQSLANDKHVAHLIEMVQDLRAIATTTQNLDELIRRFMDAVAVHGRLFGFAWIESVNQDEVQIVESRFKNPLMDIQAMRQPLADAALVAVQKRVPQIMKSDRIRGSLIVSVPFFKNETTTAVFCAMLHADKSKSPEALMICQTVANHYDVWRSRDQLTAMATEVRSTAMVLELVGKAECSLTLKDSCVKIANELQTLFRCDYVAVGLKKSRIASCRLIAVSALANFDYQSRTTALLQSTFDEAILRGTLTSFPAPPEKQDAPALAHKKLTQHLRCEAAVTVPLRNQANDLVGAITLLGNRGLDRNPSTRNLIHAMEHPVGSCLEVVRLAEGGWFRKLQRLCVSPNQTNPKWAVGALLLITAIAMFVPVSYRVNSKCTAEPVVRSFSVAPHDGLLESTLVEPGDLVHTGQILARMDRREIGFQLARAVADKNSAAREQDAYWADGEIAKSMQSELKRRGFEADLSVLQDKQQNLEIKSTIDGVVLAGSIDKRENYPVTLGQTLYEVAPISPLRVELAIPAEQIMHVKTGQTVKMRFDGFGTETIEGVVDRIRPSSTIRDDQNVFIAEALLPNDDGLVRPGMSGHARIYGAKHSLGWSIFHRPWERFVTAIGF